MDFSSDTSAPAHPSVIEALVSVNEGYQGSYGGDKTAAILQTRLEEMFETDLKYWIVASGTASNALALSLLCSPMGAILCHEYAHIAEDERSAPEFFTGGGKLQLLPGDHGQIRDDTLKKALSHIDRSFVHATPGEVLSLTNLTECGTAYSAKEISKLSHMAKSKNLKVHLDGARLGNALVSENVNLPEMTWKAGIDILTLGLTKCGGIGCELIILFGNSQQKHDELLARAKRSGHMPPKLRYAAAQALAMIEGDLWLDLCRRSNAYALETAKVFEGAGYKLAHRVQGNEVFVDLPSDVAEMLVDKGGKFYPWPDGSYRFVCSWAMNSDDITALETALTNG